MAQDETRYHHYPPETLQRVQHYRSEGLPIDKICTLLSLSRSKLYASLSAAGFRKPPVSSAARRAQKRLRKHQDA